MAGVQQIFNYDAYGNAIGFNPAAAATVYLYSGQQTDAATGLQFLCAPLLQAEHRHLHDPGSLRRQPD